MSIEAMKQWLEALMAVELHLCEVGQRGNGLHRQVCESITSICMALDQAEKQEPVAWIDGGDLELMSKHGRGCIAWGTQQNNANTPLYTTPQPQREWVGLTDEDVTQFETWYDKEEERKGWVHPRLMANYFEAKFKEKNNVS
jgi:hypothetical protein